MINRYQYSIISILFFIVTSSFADLPTLPTLPSLPGAKNQESTQPLPNPTSETSKVIIPANNTPPNAAQLAPASADLKPNAPNSATLTIPTPVKQEASSSDPTLPIASSTPASSIPASGLKPLSGNELSDKNEKDEQESFFVDSSDKKLPRLPGATNSFTDDDKAHLTIPEIPTKKNSASQGEALVLSPEHITTNDEKTTSQVKDNTSETVDINKANDVQSIVNNSSEQITNAKTDIPAISLPSTASLSPQTTTDPTTTSLEPKIIISTPILVEQKDVISNLDSTIAKTPTTVPIKSDVAASTSEVVTTPQESSSISSEDRKSPQAKPEITTTTLPSLSLDDNSAVVGKQDDNTFNSKFNTKDTLTADHLKFIDDESIMITLPDDEIELGLLTEDAKIAQMSGREYIKLFWQNYMSPLKEKRKEDVDMFLNTYEDYPASSYNNSMNNNEASNQAFDAATSGKLSDLRAILAYYPVLQMGDIQGDTLLNIAIKSDNLDTAKFLLFRGINLRAVNFEGENAFSIANNASNLNAIDLLDEAIISHNN